MSEPGGAALPAAAASSREIAWISEARRRSWGFLQPAIEAANMRRKAIRVSDRAKQCVSGLLQGRNRLLVWEVDRALLFTNY
jgi:hypothetical protein